MPTWRRGDGRTPAPTGPAVLVNVRGGANVGAETTNPGDPTARRSSGSSASGDPSRKDPTMSTPESAAEVLDRELANTKRAGIVTAAAIAVASAGALDVIGALQLWSAVQLCGVYAYVPYDMHQL